VSSETPLTEEEIAERIEYIEKLQKIVESFYWTLFHAEVGGKFHAFLEWCGVMGEHLNICKDIAKTGADPFDMNRHTGKTLPVELYRLKYMAEKMECIFDGAIEVNIPEGENDGKLPVADA